jgi:hypothetical protein
MRACKSCEAAHKPPCREAHQPRRCRTTHTSTGLVALQSAPTRTRDLLRRLRPVVDAGCSVRSAAALTESSTVVPSVLSSSQPNKRAHSARLAAGYVKTRVVLDSPFMCTPTTATPTALQMAAIGSKLAGVSIALDASRWSRLCFASSGNILRSHDEP